MSPLEADKINPTATKVSIADAGVDVAASIVAQAQILMVVMLITTTPEAASHTEWVWPVTLLVAADLTTTTMGWGLTAITLMPNTELKQKIDSFKAEKKAAKQAERAQASGGERMDMS